MDGDNYPDDDDRFDHALIFNFNDGKVKFDTNWYDNANDNHGSVSAFVPKFLPKAKSTYTVLFVLVGLQGAYPATEHTSNLINFALHYCVLLVIKSFRIFHEPYEYTEKIEFYTYLFKCWYFLFL